MTFLISTWGTTTNQRTIRKVTGVNYIRKLDPSAVTDLRKVLTARRKSTAKDDIPSSNNRDAAGMSSICLIVSLSSVVPGRSIFPTTTVTNHGVRLLASSIKFNVAGRLHVDITSRPANIASSAMTDLEMSAMSTVCDVASTLIDLKSVAIENYVAVLSNNRNITLMITLCGTATVTNHSVSVGSSPRSKLDSES
jgi:hypothetical protein